MFVVLYCLLSLPHQVLTNNFKPVFTQMALTNLGGSKKKKRHKYKSETCGKVGGAEVAWR